MPGQTGNPREVATWIVQKLRDRGFVAYFAGGCVRDELLGLPPKDYDVATDARPEQISTVFPRTAHVGAAFGVILVRHNGVTTEVATFRADGEYSDRRRPDSVTFSDAVADAQRRDFTINALFLDPLLPREDSACVIDHVGGKKDLAMKTLRAVGDAGKRFSEDDLRVLRAVRLSARLGFTIEPETEAAIRQHAGQLAGISKERVGDEVRQMLEHPSRALAMERLNHLGLGEPTFARKGNPSTAPPAFPRLAKLGTRASFPLALATALVDREGGELLDRSPAGEGQRLEVLRDSRAAFCLSNEERDDCLATLRAASVILHAWQGMGIAGRKRAAAAPRFDDALALVRTFAETVAGSTAFDVRGLSGTFGGLNPTPYLNGDDLIREGFQPGPKFRTLIDAVYDAQLEGRVDSAAQAMGLARELAAKGGV